MTIQLSDTTRALADKFHIPPVELEIIAEACNIKTVGIELFPDEDAREDRGAVVDEQGDIIFMFAVYQVAYNNPNHDWSSGFTMAFLEWCGQQKPIVIPF